MIGAIGYLGAARNRRRGGRGGGGGRRPMGQWKTGRLEKYLAAGKGTEAQRTRATNILNRRLGVNAPPTDPGAQTPVIGTWNADGSRYWNGTDWIVPPPGAAPPPAPTDQAPPYWYYPSGGGGGGWTGGAWDAGGDAWSDMYPSGTYNPAAIHPDDAANIAAGAAAGASSGGSIGGIPTKTLLIGGAVVAALWYFSRKRRRK